MLKCEAFILHVLCKSLEAAKVLHQLAYSTGYRESGIGKARVNEWVLNKQTLLCAALLC